MKLKDYQETAISKLISGTNELLHLPGDRAKIMVFQSPTGSGKTLMAAEFLRRLVDTQDAPSLCFIWAAPKDLHLQSKKKLEKHYEYDSALSCSEFEDLLNTKISEREILFLNWESIRQKKNIIIRENERDHNLAKVLEKTRNEERGIILIIDESHYHVSEITEELIKDIAPNILIEISATPITERRNRPDVDQYISVPLESVKAEGMIKKSVILNPDIDSAFRKNATNNPDRADKILLQEALKKRQEIASAFRAANMSINPLLCIQLPKKTTLEEEPIKEMAIQILKAEGITVDNQKLAIYLSGQKENIDNISDNDDETEVVIFKQAIALGWDCPRAHILVLFRDWKNFKFSIQTLGRIMRMPYPDIGHYDNELLDNGYVYTNLSNIIIRENIADYMRQHIARRIAEPKYLPFNLPSVHRLRQREKTRLTRRFTTLFMEEAKKYQLKDKISTKAQAVETKIINNYKIDNVDKKVRGDTIEGDVKINVANKEDLLTLFHYFISKNLLPYYPEDRSVGRIKITMYEFFLNHLRIDFEKNFVDVIKIILSKANNKHFVQVMETAKKKYKAETELRHEPLQKTEQWEIAQTNAYGENYEKRAVKKSMLVPFFVKKKESDPEKEFIQIMEESENVAWWYKNGENESMYFAVPYDKNGEETPFYVDFIVRFKDNTIGLYDTKKGFTVREGGAKSDGLLAYIRAQNKPKKKVVGGIVAKANTGIWKIYQGKGKNITDDLTNQNWHVLEI